MKGKYILGQRAQTRRRSIRYIGIVTLLLVTLSVIQVSFFGRIRIWGAIPDVMIVAVMGIGFFTGQYTGAVSGIGAGFLIDALGSTGITLLPMCYLFEGYLVGFYARTTGSKGIFRYGVYLGVTLLYRAAITVLYACLWYRNLRLPVVLMDVVLPEAVGTAIVGILLYFPMRALCGCLEKKIS